jgi:hypothetical protein
MRVTKRAKKRSFASVFPGFLFKNHAKNDGFGKTVSPCILLIAAASN